MKILSGSITLLLASLSAAPAWAQTTPLTVDEAIARAYDASHRLAEARAREEGAQATVLLRRAGDQPTLAVSGGYTRTNHVFEFRVVRPDGSQQVIYPDIPDNFYTRANMQWPIYTAGRSDALERAAEAEARAVGAEVDVARADLRLEVVRTYWGLVTATESVRVLEEALARADADLRDVRAQFDQGLIPPNEVSSVEAQRSRQQLQLIEARNFRGSIAEDLRRLTGLAGDLVPADRLEVTTATFATPAEQAKRAEQVALSERLTAAEERRRAIEAGSKPTLSIVSGAEYSNPNPRFFPRRDAWQVSWDVGVFANWTLWDSGRNAAEVAEAAAAARAVRERLADVDLLIATEVRQRQLDLDSAHATVTAATDAVRSAAEARRVVTERFTVGVATSTDVLDAQVALLQAELDRTRALANVRLAEARLDRAMGR